MNHDQARNLVKQTSTWEFDSPRLMTFTGNLLNKMDRSKAFVCKGQYVNGVLALPAKGVEGEAF